MVDELEDEREKLRESEERMAGVEREARSVAHREKVGTPSTPRISPIISPRTSPHLPASTRIYPHPPVVGRLADLRRPCGVHLG